MEKCEWFDACDEFKKTVLIVPSMVEFVRLKYCHGNRCICARYTILKALGESAIPDDISPNEVKRALELIHEKTERIQTTPKE